MTPENLQYVAREFELRGRWQVATHKLDPSKSRAEVRKKLDEAFGLQLRKQGTDIGPKARVEAMEHLVKELGL